MSNQRMLRWVWAAIPWIVVAAGCADGARTSPDAGHDSAPVADQETVEIHGIAYQFRSHDLLPGATISLAEWPDITAVTDPDGRYTLRGVPAGVPVTPRVELAGHAVGHQQTFTLTADLERLYFQVVPDDLFELISGLLEQEGLPVDPDACQVVTTITDPSAAAAPDWDAFLARGDAGLVPGATAEIAPSAGTRIYFNELVMPDPDEPVATSDGGVLWLNVAPAATYTLTAQDPDGLYTFPEVEVTCEPGRFINASPPFGLTAILDR